MLLKIKTELKGHLTGLGFNCLQVRTFLIKHSEKYLLINEKVLKSASLWRALQ